MYDANDDWGIIYCDDPPENPLQSPVKLDPEIAERIQYNLDKGKKKADRDFLRKFILYRKTRMS